MTTLRYGSRGDDVRKLQQLLNAGLTVDGIFGINTQKAVKAFQKAHGLTVDGIVGLKTWTALGIEPEPAVIIPCEDIKQGAAPHGTMTYGPNSGYSTYASGGCGPTSFAVVQRAYGLVPAGETATQTVQRLGRYAWEHGYRIKGSGTTAGLLGTNGTKYTQTSKAATIETALRAGKLVILLIKAGFPNGYGGSGHYIVAYGIQDGYVLLRDVGSSKTGRQKALLSKITTGLKGAYVMEKR